MQQFVLFREMKSQNIFWAGTVNFLGQENFL